MLGERLMPELVKLLDGPAVSYGKALSLALQAKWSMEVPVSTRCSANRCGRRSAVGRR